MGYMVVIGNCYVCGELFGFNPDRVPSMRVQGVREPICRSCIGRINEARKRAGADPVVVDPEAYEPEEV